MGGSQVDSSTPVIGTGLKRAAVVVAIVVPTLGLGLTWGNKLFNWGGDLDKRVAVVETNNVRDRKQMIELRKDVKQLRRDMRSSFRRVNAKLDQLTRDALSTSTVYRGDPPNAKTPELTATEVRGLSQGAWSACRLRRFPWRADYRLRTQLAGSGALGGRGPLLALQRY